jgi:hypothetical protein
MTDRDPALERWEAEQRAALAADLAAALDVDAGLREALLGRHHAAVAGDVAERLDVDGGLAAILPTTGRETAVAYDHPPSSLPRPEAPVSQVAEIVGARAPAERLVIRDDPRIEGLGVVFAVVHAHALAEQLTVIDRSRVRTLSEVVERAHEMVLRLTRSNPAKGQVGLAAARPGMVAAGLIDVLRLLDGVAQDGEADIRRVRARLSYLIEATSELAVAVRGWASPSYPVGAFPVSLDVFADVDLEEAAFAEDSEARSFDRELEAARNDFTTADLSRVDLAPVRLGRLRWSERTRWPSAAWRDLVRDRSVEVERGVYEVRDDPVRRDLGTVPGV